MAATSVSLASCYVGSGSGSGSIRVQDEAVSPTGRSVPTHFVYPFRSRSLSVAIPNFVDRGSSVILKRYSSNGSCELIGLGGLGLGEERRRRRRRSRIGIGQKGGKLGGMAGNEGAWWPTTSCSSASPSGRGRLARSAAAAAESATGSAPPALERQSAVSNEAKGKSTVLMKVGGSAMATAEGMKKMVDLVTSSKEGWPIIVVTAMGETIDNLLKAGTRALEFEAGNVEDLHELNLVSNLYLRAADDLGVDRNLVAGLLEEIRQVLMGVRLLKELSTFAKDRLISLGECITARLFAAYLDKLGVKACQIDISSYGTKEVLRDRLEWSWEKDNAIPIATGSLGKGGRDMAATVIADALGLKEIQVWEGVDGVNKSTPQLVAAKPAVHSQRVVHFDKYHGLGNDFLLVDNTDQAEPKVSPEEAQRLCDRKFGVGGDGVIFALPGPTGSDFAMRIYNSDGSEPEMCGNGIRCMAKFVHGLKTTKKSERYVIDTLAGLIIPVLQEDGQVRVDMGSPTLNGPDVPTVLQPTADGGLVLKAPLEVAGKTWSVTCVSMGNPHCITFGLVGAEEEGLDVASLNLEEIGPQFERHPVFPARTNTEFVQVLSRTHLRMRVWERGAGATLACGTGACALVVAAVLEGRADRKCRVDLPGGPLDIEWSEEDNHVYMTGPAVKVYEGKAYL